MKYYCEYCGMELTVLKEEQDVLDINGSCRICHNGDLVVIPDHETVAQWEQRKNEKYPYTAPVYYYNEVLREWECIPYDYITYEDDNSLIVATETGAPPNDWRPV